MELLTIQEKELFPSPYGVLFILIQLNKIYGKDASIVSVSLRSIIHSYKHLL